MFKLYHISKNLFIRYCRNKIFQKKLKVFVRIKDVHGKTGNNIIIINNENKKIIKDNKDNKD
jgi:hypothetical protein